MASFAEFADANINGFSIVAVKAPPDVVAAVFEKENDVIRYERQCEIGEVVRDSERGTLLHPDGSYLQIAAYPDKRTSYLVRSRDSEWCVVLRTLDWAESADCDWVQRVAKLLATDLNTMAVSAAGDYICDLRIFQGKTLVMKRSGEVDQIARLLHDYAIDFPECVIAEDPPQLLATKDEAAEMSTAHRIELTVG